jgi:hypothetical protein
MRLSIQVPKVYHLAVHPTRFVSAATVAAYAGVLGPLIGLLPSAVLPPDAYKTSNIACFVLVE